ncbi:MAG: hypothetical protein P4L34_13845 [Paludibacter sp.]|nr:hypothetical protein [Paludibacter sp.]
MFFDNYKKHSDAQLRPSLLWEYKLEYFDWNSMRETVLQRVVERGRTDDFYAALNLYGLEGFKEGIKNIPSLSKKDMIFVSTVFGIKKQELKCYTQKQLHQKHWNS